MSLLVFRYDQRNTIYLLSDKIFWENSFAWRAKQLIRTQFREIGNPHSLQRSPEICVFWLTVILIHYSLSGIWARHSRWELEPGVHWCHSQEGFCHAGPRPLPQKHDHARLHSPEPSPLAKRHAEVLRVEGKVWTGPTCQWANHAAPGISRLPYIQGWIRGMWR